MDPEDRDEWWDKADPSTVHITIPPANPPGKTPHSRDPATHVRINPRIRYVAPSRLTVPRLSWWRRVWALVWR